MQESSCLYPPRPEAREKLNMDRQTVSIMKACEVVGLSRRTIYNWISAGKVEYVRTAGGAIRIFVDSLWREPGASRDAAVSQVQQAGQNA